MVFGVLNIHKPVGPTSHDIVDGVRRGVGIRRVGHGGTLDPLASGVLVVAVGHATRMLEYVAESTKTYDAKILLGVITDTYDAEGQVTDRQPLPNDLSRKTIERTLDSFRGTIEQIPPVYSSVKVKGRTAHARVRAGEKVSLQARTVTIHQIVLTRFAPPHINLSVQCSSGTYIRSLAHDLGQRLGCGASLAGLTRSAVGEFRLVDAVNWGDLLRRFEEPEDSWREYMLSPDTVLPAAPRIHLNAAELVRIQHGMVLESTNAADRLGCAIGPQGNFVAVLKGDPDAGCWRPQKVFAHLL